MNFPPFLKEYSKDSIINHVESLYDFVNNTFNDYVIPLSNELYSEYSRHKNAYALTQKTSKKTGTLDPSKIFAYKTSDNIFKRKTILPKGKNHGIVLAIDNSSSMQQYYHEVLANAAAIASFCSRSHITLKCFSFTAHTIGGNDDIRGATVSQKEVIDVSIDSRVCSFQEIFNENMTLEEIKSIYFEAMLIITSGLPFAYRGNTITHIQAFIDAGIFSNIQQVNDLLIKWHQQATPLALANIACLQLAEEMRRNGIEHITIIDLTDGDNNVGLRDFSNRMLIPTSSYYAYSSASSLSYNGEVYNIRNYQFYENSIFQMERKKHTIFNGKCGFLTTTRVTRNDVVYLVNDIITKNHFQIHQINIGECEWMKDLYASARRRYKETGIFNEAGILGFTSVTCLDIIVSNEESDVKKNLRRRALRKYFAKNVVSYICHTYKPV